jgi:hypothetical protein
MTGPLDRLAVKAQAATRIAMARGLSGPLSLVVVNEFPKSGGTWLGQMLADALDLPFPRNRFPPFRRAIFHGHYLSPVGLRNLVVLWRDPRDVMVSWYHHCLFPNDRYNQALVSRMRHAMPFADYEDLRANLPAFIDRAFTRPVFPRFTWTDFAARWHGRPGVCFTRYEDLRRDTASELQRIVQEVARRELPAERAAATIERFSFERQSGGRKPGEEDKRSFMRKGLVGDWRNHFSPEARSVLDRHAGDALVMLGYEADRRWVEDRA